MAGDPKEIMSQEEIDAYIASVRTKEEKEQLEQKETQQQTASENFEKKASSDTPSDNLEEGMPQEEIDAHIASMKTKEEMEQTEAGITQPQTTPKDAEHDAPAKQKESDPVTQGHVESYGSQPQQPKKPVSQGLRQNSGAVSQNDIDAMITRELHEKPSPAEQNDSGEVSQSDLDVMIAQQSQDQTQNDQEKKFLKNEADTVFVQQEPEITDVETDDWEKLGNNILSQSEINALLIGLNEPGDAPASSINGVTEEPSGENPYPAKDTNLVSRQDTRKWQKKKEEKIIQKKIKASAMIRELLRAEKERIHNLQTRKDNMVNEDLYARYEITLADRSKITVSMSEETAEQYHASHPGCSMYKI